MKRIFKILLVLSFVYSNKQSFGQKLDSLWAEYNNKAQSDTNRLKAINAIANSYKGNNPDSAIILAQKELQFAQKVKERKYEGNALNIIGVSYHYKGDYPKALEYFLKGLKIWEETGNKKSMGASYNNIGSIYRDQCNYPKALDFYLRSLKIKEEIGDKKGIGSSSTNIGSVYTDQHNYTKALEYHLKALKIFEEIDDKYGLGFCYTNIGMVYFHRHNFQKALDFYLKALKANEEIDNQNGVGESYINIGSVYNSQSNTQKALEFYSKALKIKEGLGDKQGISTIWIHMSSLYMNLFSYKKVINYSTSALNIAKEIGDLDIMRLAYKNLAVAYSKLDNYKEAYNNYMQFKQLTDSIFNIENSKQLSDLKTNFEVEKKEAELKVKGEAEQEKIKAVAAEESKKQKIIIAFVVFGLLLVMVIALIIYRSLQTTNKQKNIIEHQKLLVEEKNKDILDSITYARFIQRAILPGEAYVNDLFPQNFILYLPKDIVAGDFYFVEEHEKYIFIAAADCTGHGVPGAMVSVVCSNALNRAVKEFGLTDAGKILDKTRDLVLETLAKNENNVKDGMDISFCVLNINTLELSWAGANNPLWVIKENSAVSLSPSTGSGQTQVEDKEKLDKNTHISAPPNVTASHELLEIKPDKQPIGQHQDAKAFTSHRTTLHKGDTIYLFTDGYADQFGGEKGKKFKYSKLKDMLISLAEKPLPEQKEILEKTFKSWRGALEQVDDVCVIGIRL